MGDLPSTVAAIRLVVAMAKDSGLPTVNNVIEVDSGHSPFVSRPDGTANTLLAEAARL